MNKCYYEETPFVSIKEQIEKREIINNKKDESQDSKLLDLEKRIIELENIVFTNQTQDLLSKIDNMSSGDELSVSFPTDVILENKSLLIKNDSIVSLSLNDKEFKAITPNFDVILIESGATLTINGNGLIESANGGNGYPLIADGKVIINGGTFKSGYDENNKANACIYTRGNGIIEIYGGRFETYDGTFVLNKKDSDRETCSIKVMGGEFVNFDPSNNASEGANTNFVVEGYSVESYKEDGNMIYKVVKQ